MRHMIFQADAATLTYEHVNVFIEHIIWPLIILIVLLIFRKNLSEVFKKLGHIEIGPTGVSMAFDSQIEEAEKIILSNPNAEAMSKSGPRIVKNKSPHYQLLAIRADLRELIMNKAQKFNLNTEHKSSLELRDDLLDIKELSPHNAHAFTVLVNLTSTAGPEINQSQVDKIKHLYEKLEL
jgi:hypothetical protein